MRVALGTFEVDDATRKAIRKANGQSGHATRNEVRDYLLEQLDTKVVPRIGQEDEVPNHSVAEVPAPGVETSASE